MTRSPADTVKHTPLLPCPFCGGVVACDIRGLAGIQKSERHYAAVTCETCGVALIGADADTFEGATALAIAAWNRRAPDPAREKLDRIFSYVSYVNIHGVGDQPEPNGHPQPLRVPPDEFWRIFQEIGSLASGALAVAEKGEKA